MQISAAAAAGDALSMDTMIRLNVGGTRFEATVATLTRVKPTYFSTMFSSNSGVEPNRDGEYVIDRDPDHFKLILNYLRGNEDTALDDIREEPWSRRDLRKLKDEVKFYGVESLINAVEERLASM